jgi:hypothetical protein
MAIGHHCCWGCTKSRSHIAELKIQVERDRVSLENRRIRVKQLLKDDKDNKTKIALRDDTINLRDVIIAANRVTINKLREQNGIYERYIRKLERKGKE